MCVSVSGGRVREQPLHGLRQLLADHDRAPEVLRGVVGAAARRHRAGGRDELVAERCLRRDFPDVARRGAW